MYIVTTASGQSESELHLKRNVAYGKTIHADTSSSVTDTYEEPGVEFKREGM